MRTRPWDTKAEIKEEVEKSDDAIRALVDCVSNKALIDLMKDKDWESYVGSAEYFSSHHRLCKVLLESRDVILLSHLISLPTRHPVPYTCVY